MAPLLLYTTLSAFTALLDQNTGLERTALELAAAAGDEVFIARLRGYSRDEDRRRSLLGRLLLLLHLQQLGVPPSSAQINYTELGKPFLQHEEYAFSVSHDSDFVVLAFADAAHSKDVLGVDVIRVAVPWRSEGATEDEGVAELLEVLQPQFTPSEALVLSSSSNSNQLSTALTLWTLKEAFTKALGLGLRYDMQRVSFAVPGEDVTGRPENTDSARWRAIGAEFSPATALVAGEAGQDEKRWTFWTTKLSLPPVADGAREQEEEYALSIALAARLTEGQLGEPPTVRPVNPEELLLLIVQEEETAA